MRAWLSVLGVSACACLDLAASHQAALAERAHSRRVEAILAAARRAEQSEAEPRAPRAVDRSPSVEPGPAGQAVGASDEPSARAARPRGASAIASGRNEAAEPGWIGDDRPFSPAAGSQARGSNALVAAPASTGRIGRRANAATPLELAPGWNELLVVVSVNGAPPTTTARLMVGEGRVALPLDVARTIGLILPERGIVDLSGEPFFVLDAQPDIVAELDAPLSRLDLVAPPRAFHSHRHDVGPQTRSLAAANDDGVSFDYDLVYDGGEGRDDVFSGLFEATAFLGGWVATSNFRARDLGGDARFERLESRAFRDDPSRRATFTIGDHGTATTALGPSRRLGGLSWSTNFSTDPAFVAFPTPVIGGLAEQRSVVDLVVDGVRRAQVETGPGPFVLERPPVVDGAGEIQVTVRDLLGRESRATQSYYVSDRLLKKGLAAFGYSIGFERESFGEDSFDYGDPVLALSHRQGVSDALTLEAEAEATPEVQAAAIGASGQLGDWGVLTARAGLGRDDADRGVFASLDYEYRGRTFDWGARTRVIEEGFNRLGGVDGDVAREDQLRLGGSLRAMGVGDLGRIGLLYVGREHRDRADFRSLTGVWTTPLGEGFLTLNAARELRPDDDLTVSATYTLPIGLGETLRAGVETRPRGETVSAGYRRGPGLTDLGFAGGIDVEAREGEPRARADIAYVSDRFASRLDADWREDALRWRANATGSVAYVDGSFAASRRIGRAFGLIRAPGVVGARVYHDGRLIGRTGADGALIAPNLQPYRENALRIETADLPLGVELERASATAVPAAGGGVAVDWTATVVRRATAELTGRDGAPAPAGMRLATADGAASAVVGLDGWASIEGDWSDGANFVAPGGWRCVMPGPGAEPLADLGRIACG